MPAPTPTRRPAGRSPWLRRALAAVVAVAVAAAAIAAWRARGGEDAAAAFRTATVDRGDIRVGISATGTLSATSTVVVGSEISGRVTDVLVDFNDTVTKGQVLARIDPSTFEAQIAQGNAQVNNARASLAQAQATLRNAELDWRRKSDLLEQKLIARSDVDLARAALDQARAQVNAAQAQIAQQQAGTQTARLNLGRTSIRSPVDGVVLTRTVEPGQTVAASLQAPELFKLAEDLAKMRIELQVDEADIGQVKVGQGASFTVDAFPDRRFRARVQQVRLSATTTNNVVTYPVVLEVDNADGTLLPGMTANAEIEVSRRDGVLRVPNAALRYKPADEAVAGAAGPGAGAPRGGGIAEDLPRVASALRLDATQQAAFDAALAQMRERMAARRAQPGAQGNGSRLFVGGGGRGPGGGGGARGGGGGGPDSAALRQRMAERFNQQFAAFRSTLSPAQQQRWDAEIASLLAARRAPVFKLVDGAPMQSTVRVGASDGSFTEVSGDIAEGDVVITGAGRATP